MAMLSRAEISYGTTLDVRFLTTGSVVDECDTAVLQIVTTSGPALALSLRVERGRIADFHLWDSSSATRRSLPLTGVAIDESSVRCRIPVKGVFPPGIPGLRATFVVNGVLVQPRVPVTVAWQSQSSSRIRAHRVNQHQAVVSSPAISSTVASSTVASRTVASRTVASSTVHRLSRPQG